MTSCPGWPSEAERLRPLADLADIGVHLTLTDQPSLRVIAGFAPDRRLPALSEVLRRALTKALPLDEIGREIEAQLDSFEHAMGRRPDFLDGHHHVHQLPGIRTIVADVAARRLTPGGYVRTCTDGPLRIVTRRVATVRALVLTALGTGFRRLLARRGIRTNRGFSGVHDFTGQVPYAALFERFVQGARAGTLIMCHPGFVDAELRAADSLTDQRVNEHAFFAGADFLALLARRGLRVTRFRDTIGA